METIIILFIVGMILGALITQVNKKIKNQRKKLDGFIFQLQVEIEIAEKGIRDLVKDNNSSSLDRHINVIKSLVKDKEDFEILKESAINTGKTIELLTDRIQTISIVKSLKKILD